MGLFNTLVGVGGSLASAYLGNRSAADASDALSDSMQQGQQVSQEAIQRARQDILGTAKPGLEDLITGYQGALTTLEAPGQAEQKALALSGVMGQPAAQAAQNEFLASPGQNWLRDQQEKSLLRNSAAIGGLGGGRVRSALQEEAYGRAATNQQNYLNNINAMISPETTRSTNMANILSAGGGQIANYRSGLGSNLANVAMGGAAQQMPLIMGAGQAKAAGVMGQSSAIQQGIAGVSKTLGQLYG